VSLKTLDSEVNLLIRLITIVSNTYVCQNQKGGDYWHKIGLYNSSKGFDDNKVLKNNQIC